MFVAAVISGRQTLGAGLARKGRRDCDGPLSRQRSAAYLVRLRFAADLRFADAFVRALLCLAPQVRPVSEPIMRDSVDT